MKSLRDLCLPVCCRLSSLLFFAAFVAAGFSSAYGQTPSLDAEELAFIKLINDYRAQNGLGALKVSIALTNAAEWFSNDMATKNYFPFNHVDSQGRDPFKRMADFGYGYNSWRGENIAAGYADAASTFNQWKNSSGHNANMLKANYAVMGIARVFNPGATYRWYWTNDFGSYTDATMDLNQVVEPVVPQVVTVNAANYQDAVAPDSLAALYGGNLGTATLSATTRPLPTTLGTVSVTVEGIAAQLLFVSPTQINYVVPRNVPAGAAIVRVLQGSTLIAKGTVNVRTVTPSIFTLNASGQGVPAGLTTYDGINFQAVANPDGTARTVSPGTDANPNYLVLFGTGIRYRLFSNSVYVQIGGVNAEVIYAGAQNDYAGLDQINVKIPGSLRGKGITEVVVTADGYSANRVTINIGN